MSASVLVVDDSFTVRLDLRDALEGAGLTVVTASSAAEARRALGEPFGVVILDVLLPDGDGIGLLEEIRQSKLNARARVMLLSTEAEVSDRIRGLTHGADEYVAKPYDLTYVVARAKELLGPEERPTNGRRLVLVVDDDRGFRERLAETLERAGYRALGASTGEEGLHVAAVARPDAVIVDAVLPGIDGATVVRRMKLDAGLRLTPALVLTGWNRLEDEVGALESGADAFARKEGGEDAILARLAVMLRGTERPAETLPPSALGPKKILAVDDSHTYLAELASHLWREGYEVITACSGEEALDLLRVESVDCVLLDIVMPGLSGYDTARRIRASERWRDLPIILVTELEESRALVEGINAGADDFVNKSSDLAVVGARVRAHLRRRQVEEENRITHEQLLRQEAAQKLLAALEEEKERLSSLIGSIGDEIWFVDTQRRFTLMNPAARGEFRLGAEGVTAEDLGHLEVLRPDGTPRPAEEAPPLRALAGEVVRNAEEIIRAAAPGELRHRQVSSSPVRDARGRIVGSVSVVRDVTQRKRAEEQIRRRNTVLAGFARIFEDALRAGTEQELGKTCLAVAEDATGSDLAFLGEVNRETGRLGDVSISEMGWEACRLGDRSGHGGRLPAAQEARGLYGRVLKDGTGFFTNDPSSHPESVGVPPGHPPLRAFLGVPLLRDGKPIGVVGLGKREGGYGPDDLGIAEALAPAIVQAFLSKHAEQALRDREARLAVTLRSIGDAVIATDVAGRVTVLNRVAEELTGWRAEEAVGRALHEVFHIVDEETRRPVEDPARRVLEKRAVVGHGNHTALLALDGSERPIAASAAPIRDAGGTVTGVVLVFRDQTRERRAQQALRESEARLRMLAEALPQLVWTAAARGEIDYFNRRWYAYTGQRVGLGSFEPALHPDDRGRVLSSWNDALAAGLEYELECRLTRADSESRWFLTRAFPLRDGGRVVRWFGTCTDIHDLKLSQEALREADRRKDAFLAMLSHELRNPLAPIRNSLYVLERTPAGSERALQAQEIIRRQTDHLTRLVDDLLDVTRIARGKIELHRTRVDAREVVRRACRDHEVLFQDRGLELRLETSDSLWIDADETRLVQVIGNLLQNAARFSREGGRVTVSVENVDGRAQIRVRDEGVGIAPELIERVFEPFFQADRELARTKGGLGLGLALVKGLVDLHGGSVSAQSEGAGSGAEFLVALPLAAPPEETAPAPAGPAPAPHLSVLVIEDNQDEATSLRDALELVGHRVEVACDGREGLEAARSIRPDVVVCDIGLPKMDGYEVARAMRSDPALAVTRLVAVTGYARPEDVRAALEAGFDQHVAKPASMADLARAMSEAPAGRGIARGGRDSEPGSSAAARPEPVALYTNGELRSAEPTAAAGREALVSRASHDLSAPLRQIAAFSEALLQSCGGELNEAGRLHVSRIQLARRRLQDIIDDLLTLFCITSAELTPGTADLTAMAREVLAELARGEHERAVDVRLEEGVTARGDARLLRVLLRNLLGNAWKYTARRTSARIEFGRATAPSGPVYFVRDDGEGFDMADAGKLFQPFQRLHSKDEFEGTGLGLFIARTVVERHGGRAWIESEPGRGVTIHFTLGREA